MPSTIIRVPENLTAFTVFPFCKLLQNQRPTEELVFDFSKTKTVEPFGMLVVASEIKQCVAAHPEAKFTCKNYERMPYAAHWAFLKRLDLILAGNLGKLSAAETTSLSPTSIVLN